MEERVEHTLYKLVAPQDLSILSSLETMTAIDTSLGPLVLGAFVASILYGVQVAQVYHYYSARFTQDKLALKALVYGVCLIETIHVIFVYVFIYDAVITNFGLNPAIRKIHWGMALSLPATSVISNLVQGFFAYRVRNLTKQWIYTAIIWIACFLRLGCTLVLAVKCIEAKDFLSFVAQYHWLIVLAVVVGTVIDIANTLGLCYALWGERNESNVAASRHMLDRIMIWSIETGFLTSLTGVVMIICMLTMLGTLIWMFFLMFLAKMYSNTLLASLNGRISLRTQMPRHGSGNTHMMSTLRAPIPGCHDQELEVHIDIDRTFDSQPAIQHYGEEGKACASVPVQLDSDSDDDMLMLLNWVLDSGNGSA
ncbi:hypothetical protein C8J56DRAFT_1048264 [Mycena floridula]|nr:hypothetical protein C8J56DRAFT_1048264 [Mycena floridula]